jgi:hypothetical protein
LYTERLLWTFRDAGPADNANDAQVSELPSSPTHAESRTDAEVSASHSESVTTESAEYISVETTIIETVTTVTEVVTETTTMTTEDESGQVHVETSVSESSHKVGEFHSTEMHTATTVHGSHSESRVETSSSRTLEQESTAEAAHPAPASAPPSPKANLISMRITEIKTDLSTELRLPLESLQIRYNGRPLKDDETLAQAGVEADSDAKLELVVEYSQELKAKLKAGDHPAPKSLDVALSQSGATHQKVVSVSIDTSIRKQMPFLGGYRNKRTGAVYLHASSQTDKQPTVWAKDSKFTRDTQTYDFKTRTVQTKREAATQMARPDILLDESNDVEVEAGPYLTSEEYMRIKVQKAVIIQRYTRGWRARKRARSLRKQKSERDAFLRKDAEDKRLAAEAKRRSVYLFLLSLFSQNWFLNLNFEFI